MIFKRHDSETRGVLLRTLLLIGMFIFFLVYSCNGNTIKSDTSTHFVMDALQTSQASQVCLFVDSAGVGDLYIDIYNIPYSVILVSILNKDSAMVGEYMYIIDEPYSSLYVPLSPSLSKGTYTINVGNGLVTILTRKIIIR